VATSRRLSTIIDQSPNSGVLIVVEASVDVLSVDDVFEDDVLVVVPVLNVEEVDVLEVAALEEEDAVALEEVVT
jgi:hypothetical protein